MRCMACGAEMILTSAVQDDTMIVPGFEHRIFMCSECQDVEKRFVFTKQDRGEDSDPVPEQAVAPSIAPTVLREEHVVASDLLVPDPAENVLVESTQIAPLELTQTVPVKTTGQVELVQIEQRNPDSRPQAYAHETAPFVLPAAQEEQVTASGLSGNVEQPAGTVSPEPIKSAPVEAIHTASAQPAAPSQATKTVETTSLVPVQSTIQTLQPVWAKTIEHFDGLKERAASLIEVKDEVERRAHFDRFWDSLLSDASGSMPSEEINCVQAEPSIVCSALAAPEESLCGMTLAQPADGVTLDTEHVGIPNSAEQLSEVSGVPLEEPLRSPEEPAPAAPTAPDEPSSPDERPERARRWRRWRELVRKGFPARADRA